MILGFYKKRFKEIIIKNTVYKYHDNLIRSEKLETKNTLIDEKNYKDLTIYFAMYDKKKSTAIFSLYYHELIRKCLIKTTNPKYNGMAACNGMSESYIIATSPTFVNTLNKLTSPVAKEIQKLSQGWGKRCV